VNQAELAEIALVWSDDLACALRERTAWAHLGKVDVALNRGTSTLGGFIDRRVVKVAPGKSPVDALEAWRHSPDGRVVDRVLLQANMMFAARLPPASRVATLSEAWLGELDAGGPIVLLGTGSDLVTIARATLSSPARPRLHACATEGRGGSVSAISGEAGACNMVAMVSASPGPDGIHVVTVLDVKTKGSGKLKRIDVRL